MTHLLIGLAAGFFGGLVGLGGGVIMIPLMVGILKVNQHTAHGTSLVALVCTGLMGASTYIYNGSVDFLAAALLASTAIFTSRAGARYAGRLTDRKLKQFFNCLLIAVALLLLLKPFIYQFDGPASGWSKIVILLLCGVFTGFLSGLMGVGGGIIMVPAMALLAGLPQTTAQGSSLLAMVPIGMVGAYTHWRSGNINVGLLPGLIPGILLGAFLGGTAAHLAPEDTLRVIFAVVLVATSLKDLLSKTGPKPAAEPEKQKEL